MRYVKTYQMRAADLAEEHARHLLSWCTIDQPSTDELFHLFPAAVRKINIYSLIHMLDILQDNQGLIHSKVNTNIFIYIQIYYVKYIARCLIPHWLTIQYISCCSRINKYLPLYPYVKYSAKNLRGWTNWLSGEYKHIHKYRIVNVKYNAKCLRLNQEV